MTKPYSKRNILLACLGLWLAGWSCPAQTPLSNLVVTVGTTTTYGNTNLAYVRIGALEPQLLSGKTFQIYAKNGSPATPGTYTLHGTIYQPADTGTIGNLLNQSLSLGEDTNALSGLLNTLLNNLPGESSLTLPQKVLAAFQQAAIDPATAQLLGLLTHVNPALTLCAGQAFSEPITNTVTSEVREATPASGVNVLGRVTLTAGAPVILPARERHSR